MLNGYSSPVVCTTNANFHPNCFVNLKELITHPYLHDDEKLLGVWFATQCANNPQHSCSLTYEQISTALDKPLRFIHRASFRLKLMGFLEADIPIWYAEPTKAMCTAVLKFEMTRQHPPISFANDPQRFKELS